MFGSDCQHENTLVISSVGISRTVCESCGHISFEVSRDLGKGRRSPVRSQFKKVG
jgi:hypothetical protein